MGRGRDSAGTLRSSLGNRQLSRIVDLGCGSGELTTRIASLWPAAEIVAVDQSGWCHAWDTRPFLLLEQARCLLTVGGLLVSVEQTNHEFGIGAWGPYAGPRASRSSLS